MLRAVLVVTVTAALLAVTVPVVEDARVEYAEIRVAGEIDRLERAADRLVAENDPVEPGRIGARRTLTLRLPERSWGSSGVETFRFPAGEDAVRWRVDGGRSHTRRLAESRVVGPPDGVSLGSGGPQRVALELRRGETGPRVVVRRPRFKSDAGARSVHVRSPGSPGG